MTVTLKSSFSFPSVHRPRKDVSPITMDCVYISSIELERTRSDWHNVGQLPRHDASRPNSLLRLVHGYSHANMAFKAHFQRSYSDCHPGNRDESFLMKFFNRLRGRWIDILLQSFIHFATHAERSNLEACLRFRLWTGSLFSRLTLSEFSTANSGNPLTLERLRGVKNDPRWL